MITIDPKKLNGYIEGYYGRILNWNERFRILRRLYKNNLNTYFYCPKEDLSHRLYWRKPYTKKWEQLFKHFCYKGNNLGINIIAGISPGLDYNFQNNRIDFDLLCSKINQLLENGSNYIAIMFDDIPDDFHLKEKHSYSEGYLHALLSNSLYKQFKEKIFVVPRIYADEIPDNDDYILNFTNEINENIPIFYCGKKIVADTQSKNEIRTISTAIKNKIIIWDNLYANDYCPRKLYVGPWHQRNNLNNVLFNLTGMVETDLFIIDLIGLTINNIDENENWNSIIQKHQIPRCFKLISKYFLTPNFKLNFNRDDTTNFSEEIKALDFLLWKWKTPLSREWYPYLLIVKQDLQLFLGKLTDDRLNKIYSVPSNYIFKNFNNK